MASSAEGVCLVARAIPLKTVPDEKDQIAVVNSLAAHLDSLSLKQSKNETEKKGESRKKMLEEANISPADHLALQSLRSSALARKTNTTTKLTRDCQKLFADLMMGEGGGGEKTKKSEEKKEITKIKESAEEKEEEEPNCEKKVQQRDAESEGERGSGGGLLARGPIRAPPVMGRGASSAVFHPYASSVAHSNTQSSPTNGFMSPFVSFNATALQSTVFDHSSYNSMASAGFGYECGLTSNCNCGGGSVGRDSVLSSPSSTPDTVSAMSPGGRSERTELPDDLSDFILEYSRRYSPEVSRKFSLGSQGISGGSPQSDASSDDDRIIPSSGNSPLCAPQSSPAAPWGGVVNNEHSLQFNTKSPAKKMEKPRPAKERLRAMIQSEDMDNAWAWTCKCIQRHPMALHFQDGDGDTLLHIVMAHLDFAKIYALVEQMLKAKAEPQKPMLFDVPNRMGETPLMVAVQKGQPDLVDYLLEAGASPNTQSCRLRRDTPLHFAAAHGMTQIVKILCAHPSIALNSQNGNGLTPVLNALKNHAVRNEETQSQIDNFGTIEFLLRFGADVSLSDSASGKTLVHYAVEKMDVQLIELLRSNVDERRMAELVDQKDFCGETPMNTLSGMSDRVDESQKAKMCLALITCGAKAC